MRSLDYASAVIYAAFLIISRAFESFMEANFKWECLPLCCRKRRVPDFVCHLKQLLVRVHLFGLRESTERIVVQVLSYCSLLYFIHSRSSPSLGRDKNKSSGHTLLVPTKSPASCKPLRTATFATRFANSVEVSITPHETASVVGPSHIR